MTGFVSYSAENISEFSSLLASALSHPDEPLRLIEAANVLLPFDAALFVINRSFAKPLYVCDTYPPDHGGQAIKRYVESTYLINPVYNRFLTGLSTGLYRMRDLAPDQWHDTFVDQAEGEIHLDTGEEIGYLTRGWPAGKEELVLVSRISNELMAEISFAKDFAKDFANGGFTEQDINYVRPFAPLLTQLMDVVCANIEPQLLHKKDLSLQLAEFASEKLTPRENQLVQLILKGHSGKSICAAMNISLPTMKSHRRNAYSKLGVRNQRDLFHAFIRWQSSQD